VESVKSAVAVLVPLFVFHFQLSTFAFPLFSCRRSSAVEQPSTNLSIWSEYEIAVCKEATESSQGTTRQISAGRVAPMAAPLSLPV